MLPTGRIVTFALPFEGRVAEGRERFLPWRETSPSALLPVGEGSQN